MPAICYGLFMNLINGIMCVCGCDGILHVLHNDDRESEVEKEERLKQLWDSFKQNTK